MTDPLDALRDALRRERGALPFSWSLSARNRDASAETDVALAVLEAEVEELRQQCRCAAQRWPRDGGDPEC